MSAETNKATRMRASSKWKRLANLDERHRKWRESATHSKASLSNSLLNAKTKEEEHKALLGLAEMVKRDAEALNDFTAEIVGILIGTLEGSLEKSIIEVYEKALGKSADS